MPFNFSFKVNSFFTTPPNQAQLHSTLLRLTGQPLPLPLLPFHPFLLCLPLPSPSCMPKHVISVSSDEESPVLATPLPLTSQRVTRRSRGEALVVPAKKRRLSTSAGEATEVSRQARGPSKRVVVRKAQKVPDAETLLVKYAPRAFADLVTSSQRNKDVTKWVADNNKPAPRSKVLFLYGSPGSGMLWDG